ncbi:MAG: aminotransferase class V-fold PLP-dependent enzyme [Myxococcota bacterium]
MVAEIAGPSLEEELARFRPGIIGQEQRFVGPYGEQRIVYADWTASGRLYAPIERRLTESFGPFVGNTHSEQSVTGTTMTRAYKQAQEILKRHVNAGPDDVLLMTGTGMTGAVSKFQRILGLAVPDRLRSRVQVFDRERPVVFITHMEHHSNQTSWLETLAEVEVLEADARGLVDPNSLARALEKHADRPTKIGSFTACSNVTGIEPDHRALARLMHQHGGLCFVDYAASAPYVDIDMHPADPLERLDGIFFSPHKFLGGPGSPGVLLFDRVLYKNAVPDQPGGGTVLWTNPWGQHHYVEDIEIREDGGTPGFLQTIRAALAVRLKEQMGTARMRAREAEMVPRAMKRLRAIPRLRILAEHIEERLGIFSFYVEGVHYNLMVRLLNDRFGVQVRGGCSCAGTYGHYLLHVDPSRSRSITDRIDEGDLSLKPGWVRLSIHPTMSDAELDYALDAVEACAKNAERWGEDYIYHSHTNEYVHRQEPAGPPIAEWFTI